MGFISKFLGSAATKTVLLQGVVVPVVATIVGFEVQKKLIKREQKKMILQQQANAQAEEVEAEEVDVDSEFRQ